MRSQKSILLVTVDCLRADHVGFMGYPRTTTPFLDSLAGDAFVFRAAIVAGAPTYYSVPSILASRYPLALGRDVLGLAPGELTIASVAKQAGYATAAFSAANPYIAERFGFAQSFDVFCDFNRDELQPVSNERENVTASHNWTSRLNRPLQKISNSLGPLGAIYDELYFRYCQRVTPVPDSIDALRRFPSADVIVDHACNWLASIGDAPFFLWLHVMDPHAPYYPKESAMELMKQSPVTPYRARFLNSSWNRSDLSARRLASYREEIVALYDAGIRSVDLQIARLAESLQAAGQWDDCVFALTADHGEEFLDHEGKFHPPSRLMEEVIRVPLLMQVPGREKKQVRQSPFSLLHLAPTLLDAAQLPIPASFQGRSYWPELCDGSIGDAVAISECVAGCTNPFHPENRMGPRALSVREARFKLVLHFDAPTDDLYDLEADPGERAPLPPEVEKPVRRRLLELAREHLQRPIDDGMRLPARLHELRLEWSAPAAKASAVAS
ncbi:MAG: sulfatase [Candidatus Sulfotelmatobacter sp.]